MAEAVFADHPEPVTITVTVTPVPYPGGQSQADFYRTASERWLHGRLMGSNATRAVAATLAAVAEALDARVAPEEPHDGP